MEITTLGVGIDPSRAVSGAATAVRAAESMATGMNAAGTRAEASERRVGAAAQEMAREVQTGADKSGRSANNLANHSAWGRLRSSLSGMAGNFTSASGGIVKAILTIGAAFGALQAAMLPVMALMGTMRAGFNLLAGAINGAAAFEDYNIQWAVLLGSFEEAKTKMAELADIAAKTPFNLPDIVTGSLSLQTYSEGVLSTRNNIMLLGDAAAKAKQPFATMAETMGRIFVGAKAGSEIMEQLKTVLGQGIINTSAFTQLQQLGGVEANAGGKNFAKIWSIMEGEMSKAKNSMLLMSEATNGLFSTLEDGWAGFQRTFGEALNVGVRPLVRSLTEEIGSWTERAKQLAPKIEEAAIQAAALVDVLRQPGGFDKALIAAWDMVKTYATQIINSLGDILKNRFEIAVFGMTELFGKMQTAEFWKGMSDQLVAAADGFVSKITLGLSKFPGWFSKELEASGAALTKLGTGIATGNPNLIISSFSYDSPASPGSGPATTTSPGKPAPLTMEQAMKNNQPPGESPTVVALRKELEKAQEEIRKKNAITTNNALLPPKSPGGATTPATDPAAAKEAEREAKSMETLAQRYIEAAATPMEKYNETMAELQMLQERGLLTNTQYAANATLAAEQHGHAVEAAAEKAKRAAFEQLSPLQQLMHKWGDMKTVMQDASREIAGSISSGMTDAFTDMITGASSASDAFARMGRSIVNDLARIAMQMLVNLAIQQAAGFIGGMIGGPAGAAAGQAAAKAVVAHSGGVVGEVSSFRSVPASSFRNAPRFQHGGKVGSGETPAILEPGETVLTRDNANDIKGRLGGTQGKQQPQQQGVTILNVVDRSLIEQHIAANPSIILNAIGNNASKIRRALKV